MANNGIDVKLTTIDTTPAIRVSGPKRLPNRLAQQIVQYLSDQGAEYGARLREEHLAEHLKVSRTPVRAALKFLTEMGIAENIPNRGYFLKVPASNLVASPVVPDVDDDESIYFRIGEDRLSGKLPQRVTESELLRRYTLTKTQLASLLRRMTQEGWIERLPARGWMFVPILDSAEGYQQMYYFRSLIEPSALLVPDYHLSAETISRLKAQQQSMLDGGLLRYSRAENFQLGATFHESIVDGSQNAFLMDAIRRVNRLRRLMDYRAHEDRSRLVQECKEHLLLLDLIEKGRLVEAADFLRQHINAARNLKMNLAAKAKV